MTNQANASEQHEEKARVKKKANLPNKDVDLVSVSKDASATWTKDNTLSLKWITRVAFQASVATFENSLRQQTDLKGDRSIVTKVLSGLNTEITKNTDYIKVYLTELYSKADAPSYYAKFGIIKSGTSYKLPSDNDKRLMSLEQMIKGLAAHNLDEKPFGKVYWTDIKNRFAAALAQSRSTVGSSSEQVGTKNEHRKIIRKVLNSLVLRIKSDYPDTYKEELRRWGFQKESY